MPESLDETVMQSMRKSSECLPKVVRGCTSVSDGLVTDILDLTFDLSDVPCLSGEDGKDKMIGMDRLKTPDLSFSDESEGETGVKNFEEKKAENVAIQPKPMCIDLRKGKFRGFVVVPSAKKMVVNGDVTSNKQTVTDTTNEADSGKKNGGTSSQPSQRTRMVEACKDKYRDIVQNQEDVVLDRNAKNALNARLNREKKKKYVAGLEKENEELKQENTELKSRLNILEKEQSSQLEEMSYLRSVLKNESSLSALLKNLGNVDEVRLASRFSHKRSADDVLNTEQCVPKPKSVKVSRRMRSVADRNT